MTRAGDRPTAHPAGALVVRRGRRPARRPRGRAARVVRNRRALRRHRVGEVDEARQQLLGARPDGGTRTARCRTPSKWTACAHSWSARDRRRSTSASARGHEPLPIFGLADDDLADRGAIVETMLDVLYDRFVVAGATTTVLQDWRKGRRSEAADLNGFVAAEGARLGIPTPANTRDRRSGAPHRAGRADPRRRKRRRTRRLIRPSAGRVGR